MAIPAILAALARSAAGAGAGAGAAAAGSGEAALFKKVGPEVKKFGGSLDGVARSANLASASMGQAAGAFASVSRHVVSSLTTGLDIIKGIAAPMAELVGLHAPAAVKQFQLAVNDASAVIGTVLLPVFNALTKAARIVGNTYASLESSLAPAMTGIASAIETVFKEMGSVAKENAGVIRLMSEAIGFMAKTAGHATSLILKLSQAFLIPARRLAGLLGFGAADDKSGVGRAVRPVTIGKSGEDVARRAQEAAFTQGLGGPKEDPQVNLLGGIKDGIDKLVKFADEKIPTKEDLRNFLKGAASGAKDVVAGAADSGVSLGGIARWAASLATR